MKNQSLVLLVVAVGCGLVAMLGVRQALSHKPPASAATMQVLSASALIQPGDRLDDANTVFVEVAVSSCPEGAITSMDDVAERAMMVPAMPGDWILKGKLTEKGQMGAVASLPAGMAAVTIPVDGTTSHSGMLRPGNRVDLLLTYLDSSSGTNQQKTITVLEFVEVFAVDARIYGIDKAGDAAAKTVSLLVTPEQGKAVTLGSRVGTLSTMMRARGDASAKGETEISQEFLTSSFMGSNKDAPSVMDRLNSGVDPNADMERIAAAEKATTALTMDQLIGQELDHQSIDPGGSEPVLITAIDSKKNFWTMEIYEGDKLRLEKVELPEAAKAETPATPTENWNVWDLLKTN